MSTLAIATATGAAQNTVLKELTQIESVGPDRITGVNGKSYSPTRPPRERVMPTGHPLGSLHGRAGYTDCCTGLNYRLPQAMVGRRKVRALLTVPFSAGLPGAAERPAIAISSRPCALEVR
jgi:hypothetical protein